MKAAAEELRALGCVPFAGFCTDPCDGRTQGTPGMMDSLPYRNDAAQVLEWRPPRPDLAPDPGLPADTRLWAALQAVSGGTWGGSVYDVDAVVNSVAMAR
jgi:hypothetical protein